MTRVTRSKEQVKYGSPRQLMPGTVYLDNEGDVMLRDDEEGATQLGNDGVRVDDLDNYQVMEVYEEVVVR